MALLELTVFLGDTEREQLDVGSPLLDIQRQDVAPGPMQVVGQVEDLAPEAFASG